MGASSHRSFEHRGVLPPSPLVARDSLPLTRMQPHADLGAPCHTLAALLWIFAALGLGSILVGWGG